MQRVGVWLREEGGELLVGANALLAQEIGGKRGYQTHVRAGGVVGGGSGVESRRELPAKGRGRGVEAILYNLLTNRPSQPVRWSG